MNILAIKGNRSVPLFKIPLTPEEKKENVLNALRKYENVTAH